MVIQRVTTANNLSKDVLYFGSAVPLETSEGLEAIQQPLRCRYPVDKEESLQGIMSTLTVLPDGIQLRYKADPSHVVLFPYSALSMCAAVRCIKNVTADGMKSRFVSLSSPEAGGANAGKPAIFTAITRRTKGRQVLECHGFITVTPRDALDLVQWTSMYDRRAKQGSYATVNSSVNQSATYEAGFRGDMSFRGETTSLPEYPIQLVPGDVVPNAPPAFYNEPPSTGYFYATKDAQVKNYSLHKFTTGGGGVTAGHVPPPGPGAMPPPIHEIPPTPIPPQMTQSVVGPPPGAETIDRRGYAASVVSAPAYGPVGPRPPMMVPVRGYRPVMLRPVVIPPPRARFFSPPPAAVRARPVPVFVPGPPPPPPEGYYPRPNRRGSRGSSGSSSRDSSSPNSPRVNGRTQGRMAQQNGDRDDSSETSSRPRTPPTDYDIPKGPRVSRREDYYMRQQFQSQQRNGSPMRSPSGKGKNRPAPPRGYYMVPQYGYYPPPHPGAYGRPRSVPPYGDRESMKRKEKKSKKSKKDRKKHGKKGNADLYDESTDSVGYTSEFGNENRQPRDFRRLENQFQHERAFSKSLAEEGRRSRRNEENMNAYSLNNMGSPDGDYPLL